MYRCQCRGKGRCSDATAIDLDWTSVCALNESNSEICYWMTKTRSVDPYIVANLVVGNPNGRSKRTTTCQWSGIRYCQRITNHQFPRKTALINNPSIHQLSTFARYAFAIDWSAQYTATSSMSSPKVLPYSHNEWIKHIRIRCFFYQLYVSNPLPSQWPKRYPESNV